MRALISGVAAGGIGGASAIAMAREALKRGEEAALVVAATGTKPGLLQVVDELEAIGAKAWSLSCDLRDPSGPADLVGQAIELAGGLDVVVANAGVARSGSMAELDVSDWDMSFAINVRAVWLLAKAAHAELARSRGAFIATGSVSGSAPQPNNGAYSVSKAALVMLCQQLAIEWAAEGIRVNVVAPGPLRTPFTEASYQRPGFAEQRARAIPMGRIGTAEDVAAVVTFLAGPGGAYVTGETIAVDGGLARAGLAQLGAAPPSRHD